jgi:actin-related protein
VDYFCQGAFVDINHSFVLFLFQIKFSPALPIERQNAAWIGGSVLSICGSFEQLWISKQEYSEYGSNIVPKRFVY